MNSHAKHTHAAPEIVGRNRRRQTKYQRVYNTLLRAIRRGDYPLGSKLPSEPELMREFKVSRITVIRALRDLQTAGVVCRRHGSGSYVQESQPPSLLRIGLLFPRLLEPDSIFTIVHQTLTRESQKYGWQVTFHEISDQCEPEGVVATLEQFSLSGARGVIFLPLPITARGAEVNETVARQCMERHLPLVLLDRDIRHLHDRSPFDVIGSDNELGGFLAAQHLIQRGCRRVLFFTGGQDHPTVEARLEGIRNAVGVLPSSELAICSDDADDLDSITKVLLKHRPDGIACANDLTAAKVMRCLFKLGVKVPGQTKLVGFDDTPTAALLPVPLTSIRQSPEEMAIQAMQIMRQRMERPQMQALTVAITCKLIERESTARCTGSH